MNSKNYLKKLRPQEINTKELLEAKKDWMKLLKKIKVKNLKLILKLIYLHNLTWNGKRILLLLKNGMRKTKNYLI